MVSSIVMLLHLMFVYLCVTSMDMEDILEFLFLCLMPCQSYCGYIKVTYNRIVLPVRSLGWG